MKFTAKIALFFVISSILGCNESEVQKRRRIANENLDYAKARHECNSEILTEKIKECHLRVIKKYPEAHLRSVESGQKLLEQLGIKKE